MTTRELPPRPNLEQYKKQAKDLLKSYEAGDPDALTRITQFHPQFQKVDTAVFRLADAQWVIAREHGFESWPRFVNHMRRVEASSSETNTFPEPAFAIDLDVRTDELSCVFTRDGARAVTCAPGRPVSVWDVETGRCVMSLDDRSVGASIVTWSHDERHIFYGARDGTVQMWDVEIGLCWRAVKVHGAFVRCIDVSSDGSRVLSGAGTRDHAVRLWDVETEQTLRAMQGHSDGVYDVAFDRDHRRALSGSRDTTVRLWDLENGDCMKVFKGHSYHVQSVIWGADQRRILSSSRDIRLWDVESGRCIRVFDQEHTDTIRKLAWSADQLRALSASHDGTVRLWDVESGRCLRVFEGHPVGVVTVAWSPDERRAFSCDWQGGIRVWTA